jgi:hypothetical protein
MIGVIYLGNNPETQERLKYIPGRMVQFATNYKEAANMCSPHILNEHFILFCEQSVQTEDVTAITYIKKKYKNVYIILLTHQLTTDDRKIYQKCGINDTLEANATITEINRRFNLLPTVKVCCSTMPRQSIASYVLKFHFGSGCSISWYHY